MAYSDIGMVACMTTPYPRLRLEFGWAERFIDGWTNGQTNCQMITVTLNLPILCSDAWLIWISWIWVYTLKEVNTIRKRWVMYTNLSGGYHTEWYKNKKAITIVHKISLFHLVPKNNQKFMWKLCICILIRTLIFGMNENIIYYVKFLAQKILWMKN